MRTLSLLLTYFLAITPGGLLRRGKKDPLHRTWDPNAPSYWIRLDS